MPIMYNPWSPDYTRAPAPAARPTVLSTELRSLPGYATPTSPVTLSPELMAMGDRPTAGELPSPETKLSDALKAVGNSPTVGDLNPTVLSPELQALGNPPAGKPGDELRDIAVDVEDPDSAVIQAKVAYDAEKRKARIKRVQKILISNGLLSGEGAESDDGILGAKTAAAMDMAKKVQKILGVKQDGIIGKNTLKKAAEKGISIEELIAHVKGPQDTSNVGFGVSPADLKQIELEQAMATVAQARQKFRRGGILQYRK